MAAVDDVVSTLKGINNTLSAIYQLLAAIFPRASGTFTMPAAATSTITQTAIKANSVVILTPTNAAAGTLMAGANSLYVSALTVGASFTVATAGGGAAAGTETFSYVVLNPT